MTCNQTFSAIYFLSIFTILFLFTSCESDEMVDPCEGVEDTGNSLEFKGETYEINEYNYSDFVLSHSYSFKSFYNDCADSLRVFLEFQKVISFPDFSLAGDYTTIFSPDILQGIDEGTMSGSFTISGNSRQGIISDQIITVSETADGSSYIFDIDANTSEVFGGETDVMQLNVTVPKE